MGWSCCDEQYDEGYKTASDIWKTRAVEVEKNFEELVHKSGEKIYKLEKALLDLREAINKAGVKRTPGLYEVVMRLDATVIRRIKEKGTKRG